MDNMLDTVMQQVNSTNVSDQTGNNANGEQSNGSNVDNISEESRANNDNTETPIGAKKPMHNKSKQMDRPPPLNIPFGLFYNVLTCFNRRELCQLSNVTRRHCTVIEIKFGTTAPYLVLNEQRLGGCSWTWWPISGKPGEEIPFHVRDLFPTSKFIRFKSSQLKVYNLSESLIKLDLMSHLWENQEVRMTFATNFVWNAEWARLAAKAKHLSMEFPKGWLPYLRELTSGNCIRMSLVSPNDTLDAIELPWDRILAFLFQPNPADSKTIYVYARNPFNHHHENQILDFLRQVKQTFLDSLAPLDFAFEWGASNDGLIFDDFLVQNQRTKQCLRFHSAAKEFSLIVENQ